MPRPQDNVRIAIVTALPKEFAAVRALLDSPYDFVQPGSGSSRRYVLGAVPACDGGSHTIALCLADMGNNSATSRATLLLEHFPSVDSILMVGIAGGVPNPQVAPLHVRLGDIVVSNWKGVVQYDMKELGEVTCPPRPPSAALLAAVRHLEADSILGNFPWEHHLATVLEKLAWEKPPIESDRLFSEDNPGRELCHPNDISRRGDNPRVFLGAIASSNELLKDPVRRNELRDKFGVRAVEMENAGIADATWEMGRGYIGIRGICDYCDTHKNYEWQTYAADVAAAYARSVIEAMPSTSNHGTDSPKVNCCFTVPRGMNPYFKGREGKLSEITRALSMSLCQPAAVGVYGLGGIGKTQVATHFAHHNKSEYTHVFWIDSDTEAQLNLSFTAIANQLGITSDVPVVDLILSIHLWLSRNGKWLLVFDNADNPERLQRYVPKTGAGHVLLTSRTPRLERLGVGKPIAMPCLSPDDATDFLLERTGRELSGTERPFAESLAREVDGFPLALEQAGAYIRETAISFERYLSGFRETRDRIGFLDKHLPVMGDYRESVATTWAINFQRVGELSSQSADLLTFSAYLDPDCIPFELILTGAEEFAPNLYEAIKSADDPMIAIAESLEPLARFSLVELDHEGESYSMHRLVQEVVKRANAK